MSFNWSVLGETPVKEIAAFGLSIYSVAGVYLVVEPSGALTSFSGALSHLWFLALAAGIGVPNFIAVYEWYDTSSSVENSEQEDSPEIELEMEECGRRGETFVVEFEPTGEAVTWR